MVLLRATEQAGTTGEAASQNRCRTTGCSVPGRASPHWCIGDVGRAGVYMKGRRVAYLAAGIARAPRHPCAYPSLCEVATRTHPGCGDETGGQKLPAQRLVIAKGDGLAGVARSLGGALGGPRLSVPLAAAMLQRMPTAARLGHAACTAKSLSLQRQPIRVQKLGLSLAVEHWRRGLEKLCRGGQVQPAVLHGGGVLLRGRVLAGSHAAVLVV